MKTRLLGLTLLVGVWLVAFAAPSAAGGSTWSTDRASYEPGDTAVVYAAVSWGHNDQLGSPEDGPFGVWLAPAGDPFTEPIAPTAGAVYVGDIELDVVDVNMGPHVASVEFVMPDLPDGEYAIQHCNQPCTTSLGDITFGYLTVGAVSTTTAPTTTAPTTTVPTTTAPAPTTTEGPATTTSTVAPLVAESGGGGWGPMGQIGLGAAGGSLLAVIVWLGWGRRQPSGQPTTKPA